MCTVKWCWFHNCNLSVLISKCQFKWYSNVVLALVNPVGNNNTKYRLSTVDSSIHCRHGSVGGGGCTLTAVAMTGDDPLSSSFRRICSRSPEVCRERSRDFPSFFSPSSLSSFCLQNKCSFQFYFFSWILRTFSVHESQIKHITGNEMIKISKFTVLQEFSNHFRLAVYSMRNKNQNIENGRSVQSDEFLILKKYLHFDTSTIIIHDAIQNDISTYKHSFL